MARFFNDKPVELLAPAGNFETFKGVIGLGCDAVYFGGKNLNMRLHRKDYNFTDRELSEAIEIAHSLGKKAYITVNNLYCDQELEQLKEFLLLLGELKPDALIVQDLSVTALLRELSVDLPVHASVMMNVHNAESMYALQEMGVTRVVLSREASLYYSKYLAAKTNMELEYFIHGDMCVAHGGQCLYSGMLFGQSSNRGRCLKPCRWGYGIAHDGREYATKFPLAVKDMCMYEHIPELIDGGITSFKIEGRMRSLDYLEMLIKAYGDSIDRYIEDPLCYDRKKSSPMLYESRKRDTSTAYAFGNPGLSNINERYEGTGTLFSTGKVFSTATEERESSKERIRKINEQLEEHNIGSKEKPKLCVKVNNLLQAKVCVDLKVDVVYLSGDVFLPDKAFSRLELEELARSKGETKIYLSMPHMTFDIQLEQYRQLLSAGMLLDGLIATNIGGIRSFKDIPLVGDYPLNILNHKSAEVYMGLGLERFTITPEATLSEAIILMNRLGACAELIVHGSPTVMYMEHDLYDNVDQKGNGLLFLTDEKGFRHPVYKDQHGRNHMLLYKNICYLPILKGLHQAGLSYFRIEAPHLPEPELVRVIKAYQHGLREPDACEALYEDFEPTYSGWTLGSFGL